MSTTRHSEQTSGEERLFSQASFPELYETALVGPLFQPWVEPLLQDVELQPTDRVLDVACGTGIVARIAEKRCGSTGRVVGVDLNPQMLAVARRVTPTIEWREGDASELPLRDGEAFDVVLCQQGFQFFPDRAAAARQMHRALVKGGRLGVSTWRPDEEFPVLRELRRSQNDTSDRSPTVVTALATRILWKQSFGRPDFRTSGRSPIHGSFGSRTDRSSRG